MFPTITQRLMMLVGLLLVVWPAMWVGEWVAGAAVSLAAGRWSAGVMLLVMVLGLLPAVVVGAVLSSTGNVLSGVWLVGAAAVAMGVSGGAAGEGGGMDAVVRASPMAGTMTWLALESGVWGLAVMGLWLCVKASKKRFEHWWWDRSPVDRSELRLSPGQWRMRRFVTLSPGGLSEGSWVSGRAVAAAVCGAVVASGLIWLAVRSGRSGQVAAGVMLAFMVGALLGRLAFPGAHALLSLLAPSAVAVFGFWWSGQLLTGLLEQDVLRRWYVADWFPLAFGLPVVFIGSGLVGSTMGIGLAQAVERGRVRHAPPKTVLVKPDGAEDVSATRSG
ncbi:MAG: hypothetical protein AAF797_07620 [Planctomycetota bacterium]